MYFNYFFPNRDRVKVDELLDAGLGYVFDPETASEPTSTFTPRTVSRGPGGQSGLIVSTNDRYCGYYENAQMWRQEAGEDYWVGMWKDEPPTPETLARSNQIPGVYLRLDDGNTWLIPKARHFEEFDGEILARTVLPTRLTRDADGRWYPGEIKPRYRRLWELVEGYLEAVTNSEEDDGGMVHVRFEDLDNLVIEAFQANYKVAATEIDLLGVYDVNLRNRVVRILTDMDSWAVLFKKKLQALATGNSTDGLSESTTVKGMEDTPQHSQT
jgi:hypothetical protein